ncbi:MAG: hypothetical protein ACE5GN_02020 [Waddliaceae bacterium]
MRIQSGPDEGLMVYFKGCDGTYPPLLAQIEAALSASYRIVRGPGEAKVRPVVDSYGRVIGSASFEFTGFQSLMGQQLSAAEMLDKGIAEELVARYIRMEDDLHPGNMGTTSTLGLVGIDFDMSLYPITSELKGRRVINNGIVAPFPADAFPITNGDIENFPDIQDAQPCYWPTKRPNNGNLTKAFRNSDEFKKLSKDPKFRDLKYFAFLKELLVDPEAHLRAMEPYFSKTPETEGMQQKIRACIEKRWEEVEEKLVSNDGFRKYIVRNKAALEGCLDHFRCYNQDVAEAEITFDLKRLQERFDHLARKCMVKDLTLAVFDLGFELKSNRDEWTQFKKFYYQLIDICLNFQGSSRPFSEAFFLLECEKNNQSIQMGDLAHRWEDLCNNILTVINNYRGLITQKHEAPVESIFLRYSQGDSLPARGEGLDVEFALAKALHRILSNSENNKKIAAIAKKCMEEYKPLGYETRVSSLNPMSYFRTRVPDLETLIRNLQAPSNDQTPRLISDFLASGNWNPGGYVRTASSNVLLISKLSEAVLEGFKTRITLEQLRRHDLVEVCYARQRGNWSLESSAQKISEHLRRLIQGKTDNPPSARLSRISF